MREARLAAVLDVCCVLVFVLIGRASHARGETIGGIASTSWPFLAGLAVGWVAARAWRHPTALAPKGVMVWLVTVGTGMTLRVIAGQGTAIAFIFVALTFLGLFMVGWRLASRLIHPRAREDQPTQPTRLTDRGQGGRRTQPARAPAAD